MFTTVAVLFVGSFVHVAFIGPNESIQRFRVENTASGAKEIQGKVGPILSAASGRPLVCMGAAEGTSLHGAVFEQLAFDQGVRRFVYGQPKYIIDAKAAGLSTEDPTTLLKACSTLFPPVTR